MTTLAETCAAATSWPEAVIAVAGIAAAAFVLWVIFRAFL